VPGGQVDFWTFVFMESYGNLILKKSFESRLGGDIVALKTVLNAESRSLHCLQSGC
jgi:hypothetical protein